MAALIAVVNDDSDFLLLMCELLEDEGYEARQFKVLHDAYQGLREAKPDMIVLDIRMETPEGGWQLLELLRLDPETKETPVLVCSADAPFLRAKEAHLLAHGCDVLEKPFDLEELLKKIEYGLERARPQDRDA